MMGALLTKNPLKQEWNDEMVYCSDVRVWAFGVATSNCQKMPGTDHPRRGLGGKFILKQQRPNQIKVPMAKYPPSREPFDVYKFAVSHRRN